MGQLESMSERSTLQLLNRHEKAKAFLFMGGESSPFDFCHAFYLLGGYLCERFLVYINIGLNLKFFKNLFHNVTVLFQSS